MPCLILLIVWSSSSIHCIILKFSKNILAYFQTSPPTSLSPNSSLHQAAREARNKAREVGGPPWAWAGLWQGSGWVMPLTWWFGGSLCNREFTGIRWSLTSVPICNDFLPLALGNAASAQFPGPQRKAGFTEGIQTSPRGKPAGFTYDDSLHSTSESLSSQLFYLTW